MRALIDVESMDQAKSDVIDMAQIHERMNMEAALRSMARPNIPAIGACLYCGAELEAGLRWCPADVLDEHPSCMQEWEQEQEARRRNGQ